MVYKLHYIFCGKKVDIKKSNFLYLYLVIRLIKVHNKDYFYDIYKNFI